jgi:DNA-nicking Smr family endonuclease
MTSHGADDDGDEDELFAEAMQDVAPISKGRRQQRQSGGEVTQTHLQRRDAALGLNNDRVDPNFLSLGEVEPRAPLEALEWKKNGVQNAVFARLRRGGYPVEANLDLHRKTVKEARDLVFNFVKTASARGQRSLLIAPGKGEFSKTPGRLKSYLAHWLEQHPEVIAFCSAQRQHGGVGAAYVLVRKSPASKELNREHHGLKSDPEAP